MLVLTSVVAAKIGMSAAKKSESFISDRFFTSIDFEKKSHRLFIPPIPLSILPNLQNTFNPDKSRRVNFEVISVINQSDI